MLQRLRVTRDDESGFTLVETMVALVVIGIVFAAMGGFLVTAVKAQAANERRVSATQVGSKGVEDLRALPWDSLGFYASDAGYAATHDGAETVTLAEPVAPAVRDPLAPRPGPQSVTLDGVTYTRTLHVVWFDDPGDGLGAADNDTNTHDAKRVLADLSWNVGSSTKTLTVEGLRAPTVEEVAPRGQGVISPFQVTSFAGSPVTATLDATGKTTSAITFTLHTTIAASQVRLSYVTSDGLTTSALMTAPSSNVDWTYTLPTGSGPFDTGTQDFTARAYAPAGATADGTTEVEMNVSTSTLDLDTPSVSPSSVPIDSTGRNAQAITITATANEPVTSMTVSYPTKTGTSTGTMTLSHGGKTGTFTIAANGATFDAGAKTWTVTANGTGTASRSATVTFVPPAVTAVEIVGIDVGPSFCYATSDGRLLRATTVSIAVTGLQTTDDVQLEFTDALASTATATYVSATGSTYWFRTTMATGSMNWKHVNSPTVTATATRHPDLTQTQRTFSLTTASTNHATSCRAS